MCLAVPSKIISIEGNRAVVDVYGAQREISILLMENELEVGDYVLVHAGFAIQKLDEEDAIERIDMIVKMTAIPE
jgi:hydrogenase expression/formation protein HypC